ncbi:hypothetical protein HMPREF1051_1336 [Neisseria sicca VK64]|uniref:Uncharacterized protein n=1 Tax=Neisseria sicca VK64 TaxID=1095748 RepID=I2NFX3_NEISI|nr:hypothetical protein HMPREF1051_1336 [Neisseria sicca VK64]
MLQNNIVRQGRLKTKVGMAMEHHADCPFYPWFQAEACH